MTTKRKKRVCVVGASSNRLGYVGVGHNYGLLIYVFRVLSSKTMQTRQLVLILFGLVCIALGNAQSVEEYEYEDEIEAAQPVQPSAVTRGRPPPRTLTRTNNKNPQPTSTKAPPKEEEEPQENSEEFQEVPESVPSTEPPKKTIKPVVRPFRSNDELLAALKRKRQQAQQTGSAVLKVASTETAVPAVAPTTKKANNNLSGVRKTRPNGKSVENTTEQEGVTKSANRRNYSNQGRVRSTTAAPQQQDEDLGEQPVKPKFPRGPRRQ